MFRSSEYQKGYDRGYIQALLDTLRDGKAEGLSTVRRELGRPDTLLDRRRRLNRRLRGQGRLPYSFG